MSAICHNIAVLLYKGLGFFPDTDNFISLSSFAQESAHPNFMVKASNSPNSFEVKFQNVMNVNFLLFSALNEFLYASQLVLDKLK